MPSQEQKNEWTMEQAMKRRLEAELPIIPKVKIPTMEDVAEKYLQKHGLTLSDLQLRSLSNPELYDTALEFEKILNEAKALMYKKNKDYGESWRMMRVASITDQILTKVMRIREIEESGGHSEISEGVRSEYLDILNYCVFAILKLDEE